MPAPAGGERALNPRGLGPPRYRGLWKFLKPGHIFICSPTRKSSKPLSEDGVRMDAFEEMAATMAGMSEVELKKTVSSLMAKCICGKCPTYNDCMKNKKEALFCALGKSACAITKKACLCPTCPVTAMLGLKHGYYCIKGSEKELRGL